jgi:hypothetical protein
MKQKYLDQIENIKRYVNEETQKIADNIRTELIIPFCEKYNLEFINGLDFSFYDGKRLYYQFETIMMPEYMREECDQIFDVLDSEDIYNQALGCLVKNVTKEDYNNV